MIHPFVCDWVPDDLNPGPDCPYCAGEMCGRFDGLGCTHNLAERHGYPTCAGHCGSLDWTLRTYGRVTHKHACPRRVDPFCQTHGDGCPT